MTTNLKAYYNEVLTMMLNESQHTDADIRAAVKEIHQCALTVMLEA